jgi:putative peptidoglycan lipid II flippase
MTVLTGVSRLTGLVRVVVVAAVIGDTFLGNTYQSTNTVPNILFELMAAGTLQAVLIPTLVRLRDRGEEAEGERVAASVLGVSLAGLGAAAGLGMVLSPLIARLLFSGSDAVVRADQVALGTVFLLIFLPQVAMYAVGMVASGVLNAHDRFAVPAIAPAVNNVVVCLAYGLFWVARDGQAPSLDLSPLEIALLAGGTTLGVVAFCALPVAAVHLRTPFRLRVSFDHRSPAVRQVLRMGVWAAGLLAATQLLVVVELVLANSVEGGVVSLQLGWTFFLLPFALFAQPVLTALFPTLSRQAGRRDLPGFARTVEVGTELICLFTVPAAVVFATVGPALSRPVLFGEMSAEGVDQVGRVIVAFAPGVVGYGLLLFFARVLYAHDDARTPTLVALASSAVAAVAMVVTVAAVGDGSKVPSLALWHGVAYLAAAIVLAVRIRSRLPAGARPALLGRLRPQLLALVPVGALAVVLGRLVPDGSRAASLVGGAAAALAIAAAYLGLVALAGGPTPRRMLATLRRGDDS